MAGIPFLHNIDLNDNQLLNAKLHTSTSAPTNPGTGTIWYDSTNDKVKVYDADIGTPAWLTVGKTTEEVEDIVGAMLDGTETGITVGYDTTDNNLDFTTDVTLTNSVTLTNKSLTAPILTGSATSAGSILFKEDTDNGTNTVTLIGPASTADVIVTLPAATDTLVGKATTDILTNKTIAISQVTELNNLTAAEGAQLENIGATTISAAQWGYLGDATGAITNTNTGADMTEGTLRTKLAAITESVTIGDDTDVVTTTSGNLVVTGDLTVSGDTITANVGTLTVEDKNIVLNYHASSDTSSTANGSGITIQDAENATTDATILWDASNDEFDFSHAINVTGDIAVSGTVDGIDIATDVAANTAKVTNVTTNLSATSDGTSLTIASSDGTDAVVPAATTSVWGAMTDDHVTTLEAAQTAAEVGTLIDARSSAHTISNDVGETATSFTIDYGFTAAATNDVMIQVVCSYSTDTDYDGDTVYTEVERHSTTQCKIKFATAPAEGHTYRVLCFKIA